MRNILICVFVCLFGIGLYIVMLHRLVAKRYCRSQADFKLYMYSQAVKKNGAPVEMEINRDITTKHKELFIKCLTEQRVHEKI